MKHLPSTLIFLVTALAAAASIILLVHALGGHDQLTELLLFVLAVSVSRLPFRAA